MSEDPTMHVKPEEPSISKAIMDTKSEEPSIATVPLATSAQEPRPQNPPSAVPVKPVTLNRDSGGEYVLPDFNGIGFYQPTNWNFRPFIDINRAGHFSLHAEGVKWLTSRLPQYHQIEGPKGVSIITYERILGAQQFKYKQALAKALMDHWPNFDYTEVLPPNPSQEQVRTAEGRVLTKIDNMLQKKCKKDDGADIITTLFKIVRRVSAKDLWARENPGYIRADLFKNLPLESRNDWKAKAKKAKNEDPSCEVLLAVLPRVFALIGEAIASRIGWYVEIHAAGMGIGDVVQYFIDKYKPMKEGVIIDCSDFKAFADYDDTFEGLVATGRPLTATVSKVEVSSLIRIAPYNPQPNVVNMECPQILLRDSVDHDAEGNALTPLDTLRGIVTQHIELLYAMVPDAQSGRHKAPKKPPWDKITSAVDVTDWVEPIRLPPDPFEFMSPQMMKPTRLQALAKHIMQGQMDDGVMAPRRMRKAVPKDANTEGGETFDLDDVSSSDSSLDSESDAEDKPVKNKTKPPAKGCATKKRLSKAKKAGGTVTVKAAVTGGGSDDDVALVIRHKLLPAFQGDFEKWFVDFSKRHDRLVARFIETNEVEDAVVLDGHLDTTAPQRTDDIACSELWDVLWQPSQPIPAALAFRRVSDWDAVHDAVLERGRSMLKVLLSHPTDASQSRLQRGGNMGMFPALRAMEWMRRRCQVLIRTAIY
ncbi:hypothetical protein M422DRAFT_269001 [Sphaerobolus stellatus SS14]|uniref:Uncharacterized protein n=1 Tax=Sphaerobolus stellatus (strain SS14) TaxID=990650 RepID=A0A0C9UW60_SPHS4|nr:hypothetical protein M422DRAFT_269001 [Sphaerobolus stellatus SS14]